jgi:hypothetical protein
MLPLLAPSFADGLRVHYNAPDENKLARLLSGFTLTEKNGDICGYSIEDYHLTTQIGTCLHY